MDKLMHLKNNDRELIIYGGIIMRDAGHGLKTIDMDESLLDIREIKDGKEMPFESKSVAWNGTDLDETDVFESAWDAFTCRNIIRFPYEFLEVHPVLQTAADKFAIMTVTDINGRELQQYLVHAGELFTLALATDNELFYMDENEEKVIDIDRHGKTIISDNYFAVESFQNVLDEGENITYTTD